ncbi:hypothetical protein [Pelosinus sp. IPA-1]|uniref:hypothetical protein n=1 Tax=Pelosinus sp. IPA-1 TaxID=3029569 RepID=UPI0024362095|nr:hypothetical protein [Pelosinus sp. IPA-1]GMA99443.1 hypothetical protein PIPA1_22430 [Pelosinus sp. IPA-1]
MNNERGSAALLGIIAMMLLGLIGIGMMTRSRIELEVATNHRDGVAAQYVAEAGIQWAITKLKIDDEFKGQTESKDFITTSEILGTLSPIGSYNVKIGPDSKTTNKNVRLIRSIGTVNKAKRQINVKILLPVASNSIFNNALFSNTNLNVMNATITGSLRSNDNITLNKNCEIIGDIFIRDSTKISYNETTINGMINYNVPIIKIPAYNENDYRNSSLLPDFLDGQTYTLTDNLSFANDNFIMKNNSYLLGNGLIYVKNNFIIDTKSQMLGNIMIVAGGNIIISDHAILNKAILLAKGNGQIDTSAEITGCISVGGKLTVENAKVIYDNNIIQFFNLPTDKASPFEIIWDY